MPANTALPDRMPLAEMPDLGLDTTSGQPLFRQLYLALRERVLDGRLRPGTRLPSSRSLASELKVGRNTIIGAFDQLLAEGYLETRQGSGTFIASALPESWLTPDAPAQSKGSDSLPLQLPDSLPSNLSSYGTLMSRERVREAGGNHSFAMGMPDLRAFPTKAWNRLQQQIPPAGLTELMGFNDPQGYPPLREAVADYVRNSRAVKCEPDQILITSGAQQALDLCARLLLNPGDTAAMEEPGYMGARRALQSAGAKLIPCPVDNKGMVVQYLEKLSTTPNLVYVTPAHQYPMGSVLSLERRTELLEWAYRHRCWILEDDYDSEYNYGHRPLASLQGLARQQQVIYIGSFSKVLFPGLRLGYLVLPPRLARTFTRAKMEQAGETPIHPQAITAAFIREGHFSSHLKRMRLLYSDKLKTMLKTCQSLSHWCRIHEYGAGMHLVLEFKTALAEQEIHQQLQASNILCSRLSLYFQGGEKKYGLALGFANSSHSEIEEGIGMVRQVILRTISQ